VFFVKHQALEAGEVRQVVFAKTMFRQNGGYTKYLEACSVEPSSSWQFSLLPNKASKSLTAILLALAPNNAQSHMVV
jgi:hypothetical protein